jgi:hypothetical protein
VALVGIDVSDERIASIFRVTLNSELGTRWQKLAIVAEAARSSKTSVLQEPRGVTSQKTTFFKYKHKLDGTEIVINLSRDIVVHRLLAVLLYCFVLPVL